MMLNRWNPSCVVSLTSVRVVLKACGVVWATESRAMRIVVDVVVVALAVLGVAVDTLE